MRIAYLDCFSGISGDMFLGALLDAGVPARVLEEAVAALDVGARIEVRRVLRSGISATKVDVYAGGEKDMPREEYWREREQHKHHEKLHDDHDHGANDVAEHSHEHQHEHGHEHHDEHQHGRSLSAIKQIIARAAISPRARQTATAIFQALGEAEAKIHACDIEKVHFHEVGAVDALVDIVGAAVGAEALAVDTFICSPLRVGSGTVKCAHGELPIPAPATLELLRDAPIYSGDVAVELVTPTGAAIVKTLVSRFSPMPAMKVDATGYGAGTRDFPGWPNVLRLVTGEALESFADAGEQRMAGVEQDTVAIIEANLDDLTPQVFGYVMDRVLAEGALDVFATPVQMKKNRPATLLTVLARPADADRMVRTIFAESTTLGVRVRQERRQVLARRALAVMTPWGEVRMKLANLNGTVANAAPEYEDCRRIAAEHKIPLKQVMQQAMAAYLHSGEPRHDSGEPKRDGS